MNVVDERAAFYRKNPHRFARDYCNIKLKLFQKFILYEMFRENYFIYLAARGQGKTMIAAIFCVIYCILYPHSQIIICAPTRGQGNQILEKIDKLLLKEFGWGSANMRSEITEKGITINSNKGEIVFRNHSVITVVTASDGARGYRANVLICDEFRLLPKDLIDTILRKTLSSPRIVGYDRNAFPNATEMNKEIYLTSCWYQSSWIYTKVLGYIANMLDDNKKYFICALPYHLSVKENLLMREQVENEMSELDFDEIKWMMEMEALFYSEGNDAFYKYDSLEKCRVLQDAMLQQELYKSQKDVPPLLEDERRILTADIALMSSKKNKNDASAITINRSIPIRHAERVSQFVSIDTAEGLTTDALGLALMRAFYFYNCTDMVLDGNGVGAGVVDFVLKDQYDPAYGVTYKALTCVNNEEIAERCKVEDATRALWVVKGNSSFNTEIALLLRSSIQNGKIRLLTSEFNMQEHFEENIKDYRSMSDADKLKCLKPYVETSMAINEMINLTTDINGSNIKLKEKSTARKDRYSSIAYSHWCACQIELEERSKPLDFESYVFSIKAPKRRSYR